MFRDLPPRYEETLQSRPGLMRGSTKLKFVFRVSVHAGLRDGESSRPPPRARPAVAVNSALAEDDKGFSQALVVGTATTTTGPAVDSLATPRLTRMLWLSTR